MALGVDIVKQSLKIIKDTAASYGKDYTTNLTGLLNDAKTIKNDVIKGGKTVGETLSKIKLSNVSQKVSNWFFEKETGYDEFNYDSDGDEFDAGITVDGAPSGSSNEEEEGSTELDTKSMAHIAKSQAADMYKIGRKQVEQSVANTAEVVTAVNSRSGELIAAVNNMNKTLISISENVASLVKLSAANIEKSEEKTEQKQSITNDDGRLTLGKVWEMGKKSFKLDGDFGGGLGGMFVDLFKNGSLKELGPADALKMILDFAVMEKPIEALNGKSISETAQSLNGLIGDTISSVLGEIISDESVKKFFPGMTTGTADRDYSTMVKSHYNEEPAKFDNMVRLTIVDIIPEYLKKINENLSGVAYTVDEHGQLVVEKHKDEDTFSGLLDSTFSSSGISSESKKAIVDANDNVSSEEVNNASRVLVSVYVMEMHTSGETFLPVSKLKDSVQECNRAAEILAKTGKNKEYWFNLCTVIMSQAASSMTEGSHFCQLVNRKLKSLISDATRFAQGDSKQARQASKFSMSMLADRIIGSIGNDESTSSDSTNQGTNGDGSQDGNKSTVDDLTSKIKDVVKGKINGDKDSSNKTKAKAKDGDINTLSGPKGSHGLIDYARGIFGILNRGINVKTTNPEDNLTGYKPFNLDSPTQDSNANNSGAFGDFIGSVLSDTLNGEKTSSEDFFRGALSSSLGSDGSGSSADLINSILGNADGKSGISGKITSVLGGRNKNDESDSLRDANGDPYSTQDYVRGIFNIVNRGINVRTEDAGTGYRKYDLTHRSMADANDQANSPSGKSKGLTASEYDSGGSGNAIRNVATGVSVASIVGRASKTKVGQSVTSSIKSIVSKPTTNPTPTPGVMGSLGNAAKNIAGGFKGGNLNPFDNSTITGKMGNAATRGAYNLNRMKNAGVGIANAAVTKAETFTTGAVNTIGSKVQTMGASAKDYVIATNKGETGLAKGLSKMSSGLKSGFNSVIKFLTPIFKTITKVLKNMLKLSKKLISSGVRNIKYGAKQVGASLFGTRTKKDEYGNIIQEGKSGLVGNMIKPITYTAKKANEKVLQPVLKTSKTVLFGGKNSKGKDVDGVYPTIKAAGKAAVSLGKLGAVWAGSKIYDKASETKTFKSIKKWLAKRDKEKEEKETKQRTKEEKSGTGINGLASKLSKVFGDSENPLGAFTTSFMKSFKDAQAEKKQAAERAQNAANAKKIESAGDAASLEIKEELTKKEGLLGRCASFLEKICNKVTADDGSSENSGLGGESSTSGEVSERATEISQSSSSSEESSSSSFREGQSIRATEVTSGSSGSSSGSSGLGGTGGSSGSTGGASKGKGIKGLITGIMGNLGGILGGGMSMILGVLQVIAGAVMALSGFQTLIELIQSILTEGIKPLNKLFKVVIDALKPVVSLLTEIVSTVVDVVSTILSSIFDVLAPALAAIVPILQIISDVLDPILDLVGGAVRLLLTPLVSVVQHIIAPCIKAISGVLRILLGFIQIIIGVIETGFGHLVKGLGKIIEFVSFGNVDNITKVGENMINDGKNMLSSGGESVKQGGKEIVGAVKDVFTDQFKEEEKTTLPDIQPTEIATGGSAMEGVYASGDTSISNNTSNIDSHNITNNIYGSGDMNQRSYGLAMNMSNRGCGPVALADSYSRRTGSAINPLGLASYMNKSGSYDPDKGTSVGGMISAGSSLGMNFRVGGVTQQSLKQATPNRPITVLGSGADYGTRPGNDHYVNVVGTDKYGGAYVSNPLSGRVERRSLSTLALTSKLGLYGSGDDDPIFKIDDESQSALEKLKSTAEGLFSMFDSSSAEHDINKSMKASEEKAKATEITSNLDDEEKNSLLDKITQAIKDDNHQLDGESLDDYNARIKKIVDNNYDNLIVKYGSADHVNRMVEGTKIKDAEGNEIDLSSSIKELIASSTSSLSSFSDITVNKYQSQSSSSGAVAGGTFSSEGGAIMYTPYSPTITETNITQPTSGESPVHEFFGNMVNGKAYSSSADSNWYKLRNNPNKYGEGQSGGSHGGIDIQWEGGNLGKPVYAITGGTILSITDGEDGSNSPGTGGGYGNNIYWKDTAGYTHIYAHLLPGISGAPNTGIEPGALIGHVGSSGDSSGAHLHYTIQDDAGKRVNPLTYFRYNPSTSSMLNIVGDTNEEKFWNYLRWTLNMNPKGAAALMGNFCAESNYATDITEISERSFLKNHYGLSGEVTGDSLGGDPISKAYHEKLDANLITHTQHDFPNMSDWTNTGLTYKNNKSLSPGYGLVQWTADSRKRALIEKAQKYNLGIETMQVQLGTVKDELMGDYKWIYDKLMDETQSVRDLADLVRSKYEVADYAADKRMDEAERIYAEYKDQTMPAEANTTGYGLVNSEWDARLIAAANSSSNNNSNSSSSSSKSSSSNSTKIVVNDSYSSTNSNKVNSASDIYYNNLGEFKQLLGKYTSAVQQDKMDPADGVISTVKGIDGWMSKLSKSNKNKYLDDMNTTIDQGIDRFDGFVSRGDKTRKELEDVYEYLHDLKSKLLAEYGSGDQSSTSIYVPPIDESKFEGFDFGGSPSAIDAMNRQMQNVTQTILSTSSNDEMERLEQERFNKILNNTYNIRSERIEKLLEEIIEKMDDASSNTGGNSRSTRSSNTPMPNMFSDRIPRQVERLYT